MKYMRFGTLDTLWRHHSDVAERIADVVIQLGQDSYISKSRSAYATLGVTWNPAKQCYNFYHVHGPLRSQQGGLVAEKTEDELEEFLVAKRDSTWGLRDPIPMLNMAPTGTEAEL